MRDWRFLDIPTKTYSDGYVGTYFCSCHCGKNFIGHKHDYICPDCSTKAGEEFKKIAEEER